MNKDIEEFAEEELITRLCNGEESAYIFLKRKYGRRLQKDILTVMKTPRTVFSKHISRFSKILTIFRNDPVYGLG